VLSPVDLLPEFLPMFGPLDDVVVVGPGVAPCGPASAREVLLEAWPGEPRLMERLLGPPAPARHAAQPDTGSNESGEA
jgi:uncharacterized membrane protein YkvA (DUF1232 family)